MTRATQEAGQVKKVWEGGGGPPVRCCGKTLRNGQTYYLTDVKKAKGKTKGRGSRIFLCAKHRNMDVRELGFEPITPKERAQRQADYGKRGLL